MPFCASTLAMSLVIKPCKKARGIGARDFDDPAISEDDGISIGHDGQVGCCALRWQGGAACFSLNSLRRPRLRNPVRAHIALPSRREPARRPR